MLYQPIRAGENESYDPTRKKSVADGISSVGAAYVIIPSDIERSTYIKNCFRTGTVSVTTEDTLYFNRVSVDTETLNRIVFPSNRNTFGSIVIYVKIHRHNVPVVIGVLFGKDEITPLNEEGDFVIGRAGNTNSVFISGNGFNGTLSIDVTGNEKTEGVFNLSVTNNFDTAVANFFVAGFIQVESTKEISIKTKDKFELLIEDTVSQDGKTLLISFDRSTGFILQDKVNNKYFQTSKDGIDFVDKDNNKTIRTRKDTTDIFTSEDNLEKGLKGEKTQKLIDHILIKITQLTVPTALGPSGVPINSTDFQSLREDLKKILSDTLKTD